jgi:MacB-like periplasmic core domain
MTNDLRISLRQLRKSPGFAVTAILTLALGIGANAVVFSVMNAVVLRPVKVPRAQNLYMVQRFQYPSQSYPDYLDLRDKNRTFESLVLFDIVGPVGVETGGYTATAWPYLTSGNYFDALGVQPYLGRYFHTADDRGADSAPYAVLSYAYWSSHFHEDAGVVGRMVRINKHPFTVIGGGAAGLSGHRAVLCAGALDSDGRAAHHRRLQLTRVSRQSLGVRDRAVEAGVHSGAGDGGPECTGGVVIQDVSGG